MRESIFTIAFVLAGCLVAKALAQEVHQGEVITLNSELSSNRSYEYTASGHIELLPGFKTEPAGNDSTSLRLDPFGVFPPEEGLTGGPHASDAGVVGSLGGTVDVGAMGAAVYTIPLDLPAGINGMQPNLSIVYNSQSGNGLLGWGWDLSGLSAIERTGRTRYHDGISGAVTLDDANDRFVLDGTRLIAVEDHGDSLEFKTELDQMCRVMAYCSQTRDEEGMARGRTRTIDHFKVSFPDGLHMEYGATADSRIEPQLGGSSALCWLLNRVSDRNGNSVVYHYTEHADTGEWYISSIDYTEHAENGSVTVSPEFTVVFSYRSANNPDCEFRYVTGSLVRNRRLIDHISVVRNGGGAELQRYTFVYRDAIPERFYDSVRMHTRLESIFYEVDGMELNPTRIEWTKDHDDNVMVNLYMTEQDTAIYHNFPFVGDFNGDGYSDLAVAPLKDSAYLSSPALRIFMNNPGNPGHFTEDPSRAVTGLERALDWVYVADLNDDGLDDLVTYCLDSTALSGADSVWISVLQNSGATGFTDMITTGFRGGRPAVLAGDFLGTGKVQLLLFPLKQTGNDPNTRPKLLRYVGGTPFVSTTMSYYLSVLDIAVGDFDGDGRTEVALVKENGTTICKVELSNGICSFVPMVTCSGINHANGVWNHVFAGDFNGDGMTDLLYGDSLYNSNQQRWRIFHSTGLSFAATGNLYDLCFFSLPSTQLYPNSLRQVTDAIIHPATLGTSHGVCVADFDGDGADDIAGSTLTSYSCNIEVRFLYNPDTHDFQSSFLSSYYNGSHHNNQGYYYVNCRTQYFHVGNFLGKDNLSFLGLEDRNDDWQVSLRKPGVFSLKPSSSLNSVKSVTDGMGNTTEFEYGYILQPYQNYGYGVRTLSVPVRVLSKVTSYNASGRPMKSEFRYRDPCYHRDGHGWIGFGRTERRSYADGDETSVEVSCQSLDAMGIHAMLLPDADTAYVFPRGTKTLFSATSYEFEKVLSSYGTLNTDHLVVCPALTGKTVTRFNPDMTGTILSKTFTESDYSYDNGLYLHTYHCDSTLTGVGYASATGVAGCEFRTSESTTYYQDTYGTWTVNRPQGTLVVQSRTGKPDVARLHQYEYVSPSSLLVSRTYDIPSRTAGQHPLTVQVDYEYFPDGNLKKKTVRAPYGQYGEQQKTLSYVYGPSHRLVASETIGSGDLSYTTAFSYDAYDQVDTLTPPNGLASLHDGDPLGISALAVEADGARSHTVKRWATGHPQAPSGASYYTWSGSSDGTRTLAFFHKTGAELRTVAYDLLGEPVFTDRQYDRKGRLSAVSEPYKTGDTVRWTSYGHDGLDRMTSITLPDRTETSVAYDGFTTETSVATPGGLTHTSASSVNAMGWTDRCMDPGGSMINYDHYADGLVSSVTVNGDAATTVTVAYDDARNKSSVSDPDYGLLSTVHDAYGRLVQSTSPRELTAQTATEYTYDGLDRTTRVLEGLEGTMIGYTYNENGKTKGTLSGMRFADRNNMDIQCLAYTYDSLARLVASSEQRPEGSYSTLIEYDSISRPIRVVHPSGYAVRYRYARGQIRTVTDDAGAMLWRTDSVNACGQPLSVCQGRNLTTRYTYDPTRRTMTETKTRKGESFLQHFSYTYDNFGNLATRKDVSHNMEEAFVYDDMDRLTEVSLGGVRTGFSTYDALGRMTAKGAGGRSVFSNAVYNLTSKPHALDKAVTASGLFPSTPQTVSYTGFDKVGKVKMGNDSLVYTYGYGHQRIAMEEHVGNTVRTKRYVSACERVTETMGSLTTDRWLTYLSGPFGVFAVVERRQGVNTLHYILKDHLGSWTTVTDSDGVIEQRLSYDAWGNLRDPNTWNGSFTGTPMFDRGFTGHEHLYNFGLINMNGRMYDPMMSSFLSVDRYVQDPTSAQGFNRYSYCMYNPLRFVDPTGWYVTFGGGNHNEPEWPLQQVVVDGQASFVLNEVTITPDENAPVVWKKIILSTSTSGNGGGYLDGNNWDNGNNNSSTTLSANSNSGSGGNIGGGIVHKTPDNNNNHNTNIDITSDVLISLSTYTSIQGLLHFNIFSKTWMDKNGIIRSMDFHGNGSTGGMNSYGKSMSNRYGNAGRVLGLAGAALSYIQYEQATTLDGKLEYGFDTFLGLAGAVAPEIFGLPATIWFLGGKQATFWYARTTITPMIEQGLNPGLMEYQPFK